MPLSVGSRLGPYEILATLGAGGMGEVYRARDTKLKRDVAIKILRETVAHDADRLARFHREAELLATLSHTNIAAVYDFEDSGTEAGLVLELVEGPTLADRIGQGPIPLDEALPIVYEIADALEAAHQRGIVHRDLKPANIKITPEGQVKVLDFGLAKILETEGRSSMLSMSPTLSVHATYAGVILGTAAYMSPEQARGRQVDKRTDVWAFGCVLFEMLTGRRAFEGEDVTETLGALIHKEPAWEALPASTPAVVRTALKRCLQKDPGQRIRDIGDVRLALEGAFESRETAAPATMPVEPPRRRLIAIAVSSVLVASTIAGAVAYTMMRLSTKPSRPARFAILTPAMPPINPDVANRDVAISPDGSHVVYRGGVGAGSQARLFARAINELEARPLAAGTGASRSPFFSPSGQWVGYFDGTELKRISITGGPPITVTRLNGAARGGSWGEDDVIFFATGDSTTGLMSVPAGGGEPTVLTRPDAAYGGGDHLYPSVLPNGRGVLFTITARSASQMDSAQIAVFDPKTKQSKTLIRGGSQAEYVETGHLVYAAAGFLRAVRFDLARLEVTSDPIPLVQQVQMSVPGTANYAVSRSGTLVYVPGGLTSIETPRSLVWVNRQGQEQPLKTLPRAFVSPRLSPDGTRIALQIDDQEHDIWVWNGETLTRLTFDPAIEDLPVWTPDSRRIIFNSQRSGVFNLFWHAADGTGADERLTTSSNPQNPFSITPDGRHVLVGEVMPKTGPDVAQVELNAASIATGKAESKPLVQTDFAEFGPDISPDGRWMAYQSSESGAYQIYVRPYPNVDSGRWQVSPDGGSKPLWAKSGRELFYVDSNNALMTVAVQTTGSTFVFGNPTKLFDAKYYNGFFGRSYDVSADGQRFLMIKDAGPAPQTSTPASLVVVLNWTEELKQRVPAK